MGLKFENRAKNSTTSGAKQVTKPKPSKLPSPIELAVAKPRLVHPLVKEKEAAAILCVSMAYLQQDRWKAKQEGTPPSVPFIKMPSGHIRYKVEDLLSVIEIGRVG